jgi:hypothetical protein
MTMCVLEERICNNCGQCDICDINPLKRCDSCCTCLDNNQGDMRTVIVKRDPEAPEIPVKRKIKQWNGTRKS